MSICALWQASWLALVVSFLGVGSAAASVDKRPTTIVVNSRLNLHLAGAGILFFDGVIEPNSDNRVAAMIHDAETLGHQVTAIVVRSPGGGVNEGMKIGEIIRDRALSVIVYDYCLSACANYFATAAEDLFVMDGAFVGFHGGARLSANELDKLSDPDAPGYQILESDDVVTRERKRLAKEIVVRRRREVEEDGRLEAMFLDSLNLRSDFLQKTGSESGISSLESFIVFDRHVLEECYGFSNLRIYPNYAETIYKLGKDEKGPTLKIVRECLP